RGHRGPSLHPEHAARGPRAGRRTLPAPPRAARHLAALARTGRGGGPAGADHEGGRIGPGRSKRVRVCCNGEVGETRTDTPTKGVYLVLAGKVINLYGRWGPAGLLISAGKDDGHD